MGVSRSTPRGVGWLSAKGLRITSTDKKADMEGVALLSTVVLYVIHMYYYILCTYVHMYYIYYRLQLYFPLYTLTHNVTGHMTSHMTSHMVGQEQSTSDMQHGSARSVRVALLCNMHCDCVTVLT